MGDRVETDRQREIVEGLVKIADLTALQKILPPNFEWFRPDDVQVPPLFVAFEEGAKGRNNHDVRTKLLKIIEWMIYCGADPHHRVSAEGSTALYRTIRGREEKDSTDKVYIARKGHNLLSYALLLRRHSLKYEGKEELLAYIAEVVSIISRANVQRTKVQVDQSVIDRWEAIRGMTDTHNVTFDTADGPVTAHDIALRASSPVLSAMLMSCMAEGASKHVQVKDSSAAGVSLFLDLVYTSSTCSEVDHKSAIEALDLAHRWQVESVVRVLEEILQGMITDSSFVDIASAATFKGLTGLEKFCAAFAQNSNALRQMSEKGELPPCLEKFLGHAATASDTSAPKKKRRTF
ncbi:unnamed protein product [Symbiodinium sp. CCMP2592]|nr:unnamed protein product [Symbiodinium sp. CCMP2592]